MSQRRKAERPALITGRRSSEPRGSDNTLRVENRRLKERIRQLQNDRDRDRETITVITAERDAYRRSLHAWAREEFKQRGSRFRAKELEDLSKTIGMAPLADFFEELR